MTGEACALGPVVRFRVARAVHTPARLNIATTITEDPIVPSPQSRCRWRSARPGRNYKFPFARSGIGYDRVRERARPAGAGTGTISFAIRGSRSAPRARVPVRLVRSRALRTPAPARTGEARSKPGRRAASQPSMEPVETSGPSRHTVSSHAPGAGRGKPLSVRMTRRRRGFTRHDADEGGGTYVHVARFSVTTTRRDDTHTGSPSRKSS